MPNLALSALAHLVILNVKLLRFDVHIVDSVCLALLVRRNLAPSTAASDNHGISLLKELLLICDLRLKRLHLLLQLPHFLLLSILIIVSLYRCLRSVSLQAVLRAALFLRWSV